MVMVFAASKRLATQIQNINHTTALFLDIENLWEILFALSDYNGIGNKDIIIDVFPGLPPFLCGNGIF